VTKQGRLLEYYYSDTIICPIILFVIIRKWGMGRGFGGDFGGITALAYMNENLCFRSLTVVVTLLS
jgi:hypothetical protein